jgi:hypothetical protein
MRRHIKLRQASILLPDKNDLLPRAYNLDRSARGQMLRSASVIGSPELDLR